METILWIREICWTILSIFSLILLLDCFSKATCTVWDTTKSADSRRLQMAALPCKFYNGSKLDCSKRSLQAIPSLPKQPITIIDFYNNNLTSIPAGKFTEHLELISLDFKCGNIHDLHRDAFVALKHLTFLTLSENRIKTLPHGIFQDLMSLQELDLSLNLLDAFPSEALGILTNLVRLNLIGNRISVFQPGLSPFAHLRHLEMTDQSINAYTDGGGDVSPNIVLDEDSFMSLTHLQELNWLFNTISEVDQDAFLPLENLQILSIHCSAYHSLGPLNRTLTNLLLQCGIKDDDHDALMDIAPFGILDSSSLRSLANFSSLSTLSLSLHLKSISNNAFEWIPSLRKLDFNGNSLTNLAQYAFYGLDHLEELDLSFNHFTVLPSHALQVFQFSSKLRIINFDSNQLHTLNKSTNAEPFGSSQHLEVLRLANNKITGNIAEHLFDALPSLRLLDLSNNPLSDVGSWKPADNLEELYLDDVENADEGEIITWKSPMPTLKILSLKNVSPFRVISGEYLCSLAPNLENVTLDGSEFPSLSYLKKCHNLRILDLSNNNLDSDSDFYSIYFDYDDGWLGLHLPRLEVLKLKMNKLTYLQDKTFDNSTWLLELDLSCNLLNNIPPTVFKKLLYLEKLDLTGNEITNLKPIFDLCSIRSINISLNKVVEVEQLFLPKSPDSTQACVSNMTELDLSGNPLQCSCRAKVFQDWILSDTNVLLKFDHRFYTCATPDEYIGVVITDVPLDCKSHLYMYLSIAVFVVLVISVTIILFAKYRWHISYKLFLLCKRSRNTSYIDEETLYERSSMGDTMPDTMQYDAYVAYSKGDESWILGELRPQLEDGDEPVRLLIGDRDFPLGACILDCIVSGIQRSRKTVLVLSPRFAEDEWRYFEMQIAQQRLFQEARDVLVLVLLEEVPGDKLTMLMRHMLCQRDYLKWPGDKLGQSLFWRRLKEEIRQPNRVDRINDM